MNSNSKYSFAPPLCEPKGRKKTSDVLKSLQPTFVLPNEPPRKKPRYDNAKDLARSAKRAAKARKEQDKIKAAEDKKKVEKAKNLVDVGNLVLTAIRKLKEPEGSTLRKIKKHLELVEEVNVAAINADIKIFLEGAIESGYLVKQNGKYKATGRRRKTTKLGQRSTAPPSGKKVAAHPSGKKVAAHPSGKKVAAHPSGKTVPSGKKVAAPQRRSRRK